LIDFIIFTLAHSAKNLLQNPVESATIFCFHAAQWKADGVGAAPKRWESTTTDAGAGPAVVPPRTATRRRYVKACTQRM